VKTLLGLILAAVMVLAMGSVALAGVDFTLEFSRDFDAEETSGFAELGFSLAADPFDFSLTYTHDIYPEMSDTLKGSVGLTLGLLSFGYERELTIDDPGVGTVDMDLGLVSLGYSYDFDVDEYGKLTATLAKSF